ncbi:DUF1772 domain containing protein [Phlyctema vagabunda]|uniref:DUF1772 domain containing protein n=1 Tax=Phlyctema vagabunda TaxID=108571 RepID=A0ABR4PBS8_9HELO
MPEGPVPIRTAQVLGIFTSTLTAGASIGLSSQLVPRLLESPTPLMLKQWNRSFQSGKKNMPPLALLAASSYFFLAYRSRQLVGANAATWKLYLAAGLLSFGIIPYTLLFMMPTNKKLLAKVDETAALSFKDEVVEAGLGEETAHKLIDKWGLLNLGRGVMLAFSGLLGAYTTVF